MSILLRKLESEGHKVIGNIICLALGILSFLGLILGAAWMVYIANREYKGFKVNKFYPRLCIIVSTILMVIIAIVYPLMFLPIKH